MVTKFRSKILDCGSCGCYFKTWPEYIDQDQDKGYGICFDCQEIATEYNNKMMDDLGEKIYDALSPKNKAKWDTFDTDLKRAFAWKAMDDGMTTWTIGGK